MAAPFNTPPEIGLRIGFGAALGGGSESSTTFGELVELEATFFTSTGLPALSGSPFNDDCGSTCALLPAGCLMAATSTCDLGSELVFSGEATLFAAFPEAGGEFGCEAVDPDGAFGCDIFTIFSSR